jgi:hypothetical protein
MDDVNPDIERLFRAKEARRARLRACRFMKKIKAVVQRQAMAAPILLARGRQVRVWSLAESEPS